jgi:hypothetical protein
MSPVGTFETCRGGLTMSADRGGVERKSRFGAVRAVVDPERTSTLRPVKAARPAAAEGTDTRVCGDVVSAPHSILDAYNLYVCQGRKPQFDRIALAGRSTSEYVLCNLQTVRGREHPR